MIFSIFSLLSKQNVQLINYPKLNAPLIVILQHFLSFLRQTITIKNDPSIPKYYCHYTSILSQKQYHPVNAFLMPAGCEM